MGWGGNHPVNTPLDYRFPVNSLIIPFPYLFNTDMTNVIVVKMAGYVDRYYVMEFRNTSGDDFRISVHFEVSTQKGGEPGTSWFDLCCLWNLIKFDDKKNISPTIISGCLEIYILMLFVFTHQTFEVDILVSSFLNPPPLQTNSGVHILPGALQIVTPPLRIPLVL